MSRIFVSRALFGAAFGKLSSDVPDGAHVKKHGIALAKQAQVRPVGKHI